MGGNTIDSFSKATTNYDVPPYGASPSSQETITALPSLKLVYLRALIAQEDEGGIEKPIYYISCALRDAETCYPRAEKVCLAIVYAL